MLFGAGALVVSAALAAATYGVTRANLISERERSSVRAAFFDASVVRQGLAADSADVVEILRSVDTGQGRRPLIWREGRFFGRSADDGLTARLPKPLLDMADTGRPAVQRVSLRGETSLVVAVPLDGLRASYLEVGSLQDVRDNLRSLARTLLLVSVVTTLGGALFGYWAGRRLLRPLRDVAEAAQAIGAGDLSARLRSGDDRDLAPLTDSFNSMVDELATRMERDRRFAADVSHELRSPLQTMANASAVLVRRADGMDARTGAAARLVADEVSRFSALVQDLLELARDELPLALQPTDVGAVLAELCAGLVPPGGLDLSHSPPTWPLDRRRFERLMANLLENATRHGGGARTVLACVMDGSLVIQVDDAGPGIPTEERELVFDRFGRGRAASARGGSDGTGLGLALVRQHAAAHAGSVTVADRPGGGARFVVVLPPAGGGTHPPGGGGA
ncbi:MAG: ATPase protein, partial [Frankiales bacterium]|nr:ATPase protein [Frankiales bacterium]